MKRLSESGVYMEQKKHWRWIILMTELFQDEWKQKKHALHVVFGLKRENTNRLQTWQWRQHGDEQRVQAAPPASDLNWTQLTNGMEHISKAASFSAINPLNSWLHAAAVIHFDFLSERIVVPRLNSKLTHSNVAWTAAMLSQHTLNTKTKLKKNNQKNKKGTSPWLSVGTEKWELPTKHNLVVI